MVNITGQMMFELGAESCEPCHSGKVQAALGVGTCIGNGRAEGRVMSDPKMFRTGHFQEGWRGAEANH